MDNITTLDPPATAAPTVEDTARLLAREHSEQDEVTQAVYWAPAEDEVFLVEVTASVPDRGEVLPFRFAPDPPEVPYPSVVVLLGPGDWARVQSGDLELPPAYRGELRPLPVR